MSSIGKIFRVTTFGESHGTAVGCIVENVPPMLKLNSLDIQYQLDRRKPNQNSLLSSRNEPDAVEICSGVQEGVTLGTPICLMVRNVDMKPGDYKKFSSIPRPGHADLTYLSKYGVKSSSGGGRASARETVARVAAGAVAEKFLKTKYDVDIVSWVNSVGDVSIPQECHAKLILDLNCITKQDIDQLGTFKMFKKGTQEEDTSDSLLLYNSKIMQLFLISSENTYVTQIEDYKFDSEEIELYLDGNVYKFIETINVRCPHVETGVKIIQNIMKTKSECDSIGGTVSCIIKNCPRSLGEPCFDKFEAELAKAMLSIPATKGFEIGSGFEGTKMKGSEHNDVFVAFEDLNTNSSNNLTDNLLFKDPLSLSKLKLKLKSNYSGGTLGGITTGENIFFRVAIKPVSTISKEQFTSDWNGEINSLKATGRHDPCVLPRAMPIVEAMAAIVVMDFCLIQSSRVNSTITVDSEGEDFI